MVGAGANGVLRTDDISTGVITGTLSGQSYPGGISGIIFDNINTGEPGFQRLFQHPDDFQHRHVRWELAAPSSSPNWD